MIDPAPVIIVDSPKVKSEEGLSGKDIVVIEDALEKLGKSAVKLAIIHFFFSAKKFKFMISFLITYSERFCHFYK